jgi:hypothetical protein
MTKVNVSHAIQTVRHVQNLVIKQLVKTATLLLPSFMAQLLPIVAITRVQIAQIKAVPLINVLPVLMPSL